MTQGQELGLGSSDHHMPSRHTNRSVCATHSLTCPIVTMSEVAWAARVSEKEPLVIKLDNCELTVQTAALAPGQHGGQGRKTVTSLLAHCPAWEEPMALCTLRSETCEHARLGSHFFHNNGELTLTVSGSGVIHVMGALVEHMEAGSDGESDSDGDEAPTLVPVEEFGDVDGSDEDDGSSDTASDGDIEVDVPELADDDVDVSDESDLDSDDSAEALEFGDDATLVSARRVKKGEAAQETNKKGKKSKKKKAKAAEKQEEAPAPAPTPTKETGRKRKSRSASGDDDSANADANAGANAGAGEAAEKPLTRKQKKRLRKRQRQEAAAAAASGGTVPAGTVAPKKSKVVAHKSGLAWMDRELGIGKRPSAGRQVKIRYAGSLASNGKQFDSGELKFRLGAGMVIPGMDIGVAQGMRVGGSRRLFIPSRLAYGSQGAGADIPPNSDLIFDVELLHAK